MDPQDLIRLISKKEPKSKIQGPSNTGGTGVQT